MELISFRWQCSYQIKHCSCDYSIPLPHPHHPHSHPHPHHYPHPTLLTMWIKLNYEARFEIPRGVLNNIPMFCHMTPWRLVHSYQHSEERATSKRGGSKIRDKYPEDGRSTQRRISNTFTIINTAKYPRSRASPSAPLSGYRTSYSIPL